MKAIIEKADSTDNRNGVYVGDVFEIEYADYDDDKVILINKISGSKRKYEPDSRAAYLSSVKILKDKTTSRGLK